MEDLSDEDARALLQASRFGVLALGDEDGTYGVPLFYGFDGEDVYFHSHPGLKDDYMAHTKEACLVVVHRESQDIWESVQVFGPLERLSLSTDLEAAKSALFQVPPPPAEGNFPKGTPVRSEQDVYYVRLRPSRVAGKRSAYKDAKP